MIVLGLAMSASNAFGIVLMTYLIGHSIAAFPKYLWFQGNNTKTLDYYRFRAVKVTESLDQAKDELRILLSVSFFFNLGYKKDRKCD